VDLPRYVDYGGLISIPAPFQSLGATLYGFWARADPAKLEALCRQVFAEPSGGRVDYRPLGQHVMLSWGRIPRVVSQTRPFDDMGGVEEDQVVVWIPTASVRRHGGHLVAERFAMFVPYIWLDNPMSLATGREVFGFPKTWGWPAFPEPDVPLHVKLDAFGLDYGKSERAARHPLLELVQGDPVPGVEPTELRSLHEAARHVADRLF
jgi:hypothetical protein